MNITGRKNIICICIILLAIVLALSLCWVFADKSADTFPVSTIPSENPVGAEENHTESNYSISQLKKLAEKIAKNKFGEEVFIILLTEDGPSPLEIDGINRYVHTFAADSVSKNNSTDTALGLFHIDPDNGEVYEQKDGNMVKITIGE